MYILFNYIFPKTIAKIIRESPWTVINPYADIIINK